LHNPDNSNYLFTTNIGDAVSKGIEAYVSFSLMRFCHQAKNMDVRIFNSLSYYHARYKKGTINKSGENVSLKNNRVEGVPEWINRSGIEWQYKMISTMIECSYVGKNFSDVNNTIFNPTGVRGVVPAYHVWDWTVNWNFLHRVCLSVALNNLANAKYFTRRINMYPGPGILPADGRTFACSFGLKL
jgi:Fe(3+) dicitrate transport protein